jgi:hypothetical protein
MYKKVFKYFNLMNSKNFKIQRLLYIKIMQNYLKNGSKKLIKT